MQTLVRNNLLEISVTKTVQDNQFEPFSFSFKQTLNIEGLTDQETVIGMASVIEDSLESLSDKVFRQRLEKSDKWYGRTE
jgi:hypothetical protein